MAFATGKIVAGAAWAAVDFPTTLDQLGARYICLKADAANAVVVYVGTGADETTAFPLAAGDQLGPIPVGDLSGVKVKGNGMVIWYWTA